MTLFSLALILSVVARSSPRHGLVLVVGRSVPLWFRPARRRDATSLPQRRGEVSPEGRHGPAVGQHPARKLVVVHRRVFVGEFLLFLPNRLVVAAKVETQRVPLSLQ